MSETSSYVCFCVKRVIEKLKIVYIALLDKAAGTKHKILNGSDKPCALSNKLS